MFCELVLLATILTEAESVATLFWVSRMDRPVGGKFTLGMIHITDYA